MKKGDKVIIRDSSYSMVVTNHGLESSYSGLHSVRDKQGMIVEVNCVFPDADKFQEQYNNFNNTIVRTVSGRVVLIEERFLKLANKPLREVTMAEVCVRFGEDVKVIRDSQTK